METESSKNCLPSDECIKSLNLFFDNGLYNSCQATDELLRNIEDSRNEALAREALALYQDHYSKLDRPWDNVTLIYGLGLIYMHFNAYNLAVKAFREALYVEPSFARSRDIHTRLGLIFKATSRFQLSEKHFNLAINDTRPSSGTSTKQELEFHLAHLYEVSGKLKRAKEAYERLLQENDLPQQLSANIHRQLGCMYFCTDMEAATRNNVRKQNMFNQQNMPVNGKMDTALNYLSTSLRIVSDPSTSYYLGRCFTNIGKFQDAFSSYRSVIDREESTADTWCSIGVLYHQQNQPTDALQAYIRSVQFDKKHATAWMNLGILYETHNQFNDALKCYQHVLRSSQNGVDRSLQARIKYIQRQMAEIDNSIGNNRSKVNSDKLLSLEDLWNLESKTSSESTNTDDTGSLCVSRLVAPSTSNLKPCSSSQSNILIKPICKAGSSTNSDQALSINGPIVNNINAASNNTSLLNNCANASDTKKEYDDSKTKHLSEASSNRQGIPNSNHTGLLNDCKLELLPNQRGQDFKQQTLESKDFCLSQVLTNGASKDSGISSNSSTYTDCALVPSQCKSVCTANHISAEQVIEVFKNSTKPRKIDVNLLADEDRPPRTFPRHPPYPPLPQDKLFPLPSSLFLESKKDLASKRLQEFCYSSPISVVRNIASVLKLDLGLFSTKTLVETSPDHQIDVYSYSVQQASDQDNHHQNTWSCERHKSSSTISRYASYQVGSFRESLQEERESKSSASKSSLTKESETDSNESASAQAKRLNNNTQSSASQMNNETNSHCGNNNPVSANQASNPGTKCSPPNKKLKKEHCKPQFVRSVERIDLSDDKIWRPQLHELNKLPSFIKCVSASNMLTHIGSSIPGLNTISIGMHVPNCKVLGIRTANNFCSVNINVGPGDYEWCATPAEYSNVVTRLCNRLGFEIDGKNWWPQLSDLQKYNIPIYRFSQRPGDLVWINSGTLYWVKAVGWCNNIHWNVGPISAQQYKLASESIELNKLLFNKTDVPLVQLTWNMIMNITIIPDDVLSSEILSVLRRSLKYCLLVEDLIEQTKHSISNPEGGSGPRNAKFCSLCECEIFNIFFIRKKDEKFHCIECARRANPSFDNYEIKQEYDIKYLMKLYDNFIETKKKVQTRPIQQQPQQQQNQARQE